MTAPTDLQSLIARVRHYTECTAIAGYLMSESANKIRIAESRLRAFNSTRGPDRDRR